MFKNDFTPWSMSIKKAREKCSILTKLPEHFYENL